MRRRTALLTAGLGFAMLASSTVQALAAPPPVAPNPAQTQGQATSDDAYIAALEKRGFEVVEGDFTLWGIDECPATYELMGTCFFNNPAAPYIATVLPPWPEEVTDPATEGALGLSPDGVGSVYRLDPNEAILIFGELPPEASYFGLQSYLFSRKGSYDTDNPTYQFLAALNASSIFFHQIPGNTERIATLDSLSDSNNNVVIERQSGSSWNQERYFIITPDRYLDKQVRQVLHRLSVDARDVFSEAIPSNMNLGLDADADEFITAIRYSRPVDGGGEDTASAQWRQDPTLRVLRIRDPRIRPPQQYPAWEDTSPEPRTGVPEAPLLSDLADLANQVSVAWGQPCAGGDCVASGQGLRFIDTQSSPINLVGPLCDNIGMDCLADTQDATYQFRPGLTFDANEVYAVVGTLGTATGNATYVSLGVNNVELRLAALNVDGTGLEGSAAPYPVANADKLYVHYFTRDCEAVAGLVHGQCTSVPDDELHIPHGVRTSIVERDYLAAGTQRGPDSTLLLPSIVVKLQAPQ